MRVIFNENKEHTVDTPVAIALGTFDGIHRGHQILIEQLKKIQKQYRCITMVYTFQQHPLNCLAPDKAPPQIMNLNKKILEFHRLGIDCLILNKFDNGFASTSPKDFIESFLLGKYNVRFVVSGYDYRFGFQRAGDSKLLEQIGAKKGFKVIIVPPVKLQGKIVSSSLIRQHIHEGQIMEANYLLGRPYSISGKIVHGKGRGKKLGFPTANLDIGLKKVVIPKFGVYLTKCTIGGKWLWGVTNVGINPTFNQIGIHIETHLLDYQGELYNCTARVYFICRIRNEKQFSSPSQLSMQINRDIYTAKNIIRNL
jgi:riboflavin kinase/FMN adenylyltransferase